MAARCAASPLPPARPCLPRQETWLRCAINAAAFPLLPGVTWGMAYGALAIILVASIEGIAWTFDAQPPYIASLLYLAAFGSVIAFSAYLTLLGQIGAARAGYVGVAVPVVALLLSTVFEHYQWTLLSLAGAALCVMGTAGARAAAGGEAGLSICMRWHSRQGYLGPAASWTKGRRHDAAAWCRPRRRTWSDGFDLGRFSLRSRPGRRRHCRSGGLYPASRHRAR